MPEKAKAAAKRRTPAERSAAATKAARTKGTEERRAAARKAAQTRSRKEADGDQMTTPRRWSQEVSAHSNALDLESGVFTLRSPRAIAESLRRSADRSRRRKGTSHQSAMSMLNFFMNRAGKKMSPARRGILERAREELRRIHQRVDSRGKSA